MLFSPFCAIRRLHSEIEDAKLYSKSENSKNSSKKVDLQTFLLTGRKIWLIFQIWFSQYPLCRVTPVGTVLVMYLLKWTFSMLCNGICLQFNLQDNL